MRRSHARRLALPLAVEMDVAPLIDIVFLQLIFFMLTSTFVLQPGISVHLPRAATTEPSASAHKMITVSRKGDLYLDDRVVTLQEIPSLLPDRKASLLIRADRGVPFGRVVEVWDLCRSLGIMQVGIATQNEETSS